jgi:hypothetical protein
MLRSAVAWIDRFGLWPVIVGAGVVIAAYISGIAGLYWKFPLWDQLAILVGLALILVWAISRVVKRLVRPSAQELQTEVHNLTMRGLGFGRAASEGGPDWDRWTEDMVAFFALHGTAAERTHLATVFVMGSDQRTRIQASVSTLAVIGHRLEQR